MGIRGGGGMEETILTVSKKIAHNITENKIKIVTEFITNLMLKEKT